MIIDKIGEIGTTQLYKIDMFIEAVRALSMRTQGLECLFANAQPSILAIMLFTISSPTMPMQLNESEVSRYLMVYDPNFKVL